MCFDYIITKIVKRVFLQLFAYCIGEGHDGGKPPPHFARTYGLGFLSVLYLLYYFQYIPGLRCGVVDCVCGLVLSWSILEAIIDLLRPRWLREVQHWWLLKLIHFSGFWSKIIPILEMAFNKHWRWLEDSLVCDCEVGSKGAIWIWIWRSQFYIKTVNVLTTVVWTTGDTNRQRCRLFDIIAMNVIVPEL